LTDFLVPRDGRPLFSPPFIPLALALFAPQGLRAFLLLTRVFPPFPAMRASLTVPFGPYSSQRFPLFFFFLFFSRRHPLFWWEFFSGKQLCRNCFLLLYNLLPPLPFPSSVPSSLALAFFPSFFVNLLSFQDPGRQARLFLFSGRAAAPFLGIVVFFSRSSPPPSNQALFFS